MAKRKRNRKPPQARHGKKSRRSRHDKRKRLETPNPQRRVTQTANVPLLGMIAAAVGSMARMLDSRSGFRLSIIFAGAMLATGRRTASSWFRAAGIQDDWDRFYDLLSTVGKKATTLPSTLLQQIVRRFDPGPGGYWKIAIDDSPTKRYGRCVEAANVHHNPTPGPADGQWMYGHCWVCLAILMNHPVFGVIALSVLSRLYVRKEDVADLKQRSRLGIPHEARVGPGDDPQCDRHAQGIGFAGEVHGDLRRRVCEKRPDQAAVGAGHDRG